MKLMVVTVGFSETVFPYQIRLVQALSKLNFLKITVLCQKAGKDIENVEIIELGTFPIVDFNKEGFDIKLLSTRLPEVPDIIYCASDATIEVSKALSDEFEVPLIAMFYGYPLSRIIFPLWQNHYNRKIGFYQNAEGIITCSYESLERMRSLGLTNENIMVTPLGIEDLSNIKVEEIPDDSVNIVMIGRDVYHKNIEDFLYLVRRNPSKRFIWLTPQIQQVTTMDKIKTLENLNVLENVEDMKKFMILKGADYFFYTGDDEGYMLSCMEALACGTKVIVKYSKLALEVLWEYPHMVSYYHDIKDAYLMVKSLKKPKKKDKSTGEKIFVTVVNVLTMMYKSLIGKTTKNLYEIENISSNEKSNLMSQYVQYKTEYKKLVTPFSPYENMEKFLKLQSIIGEEKGIFLIGIGDGLLAFSLMENTFVVEAADISRTALENIEYFASEEEYRQQLYDLENPHKIEEEFDVIVVDDVFSQVEDPAKCLLSVMEIKSDVVVIIVPKKDDGTRRNMFSMTDLELLLSDYPYSIEENDTHYFGVITR